MFYLEALIGTVAAFLLGFVWYTTLFGKAWQAETGMTDEDAQSDMARTHGLSLVMMFIISMGMNYFFNYHPAEEHTFIHGAFHGLMIALMFCVPAMTIQYLYQRKSLKLWLIDASYVALFCALSLAVMAVLSLADLNTM